MDGLISNFVLH